MLLSGTIPLKDLTVQDVRTALAKMAATHATRTLQKAHNCLTRAIRHPEKGGCDGADREDAHDEHGVVAKSPAHPRFAYFLENVRTVPKVHCVDLCEGAPIKR